MFSSDLQTSVRAYYWDTPYPVVKVGPRFEGESDYGHAAGSGVEYALFDLLDSEFDPQSYEDLEGALQRTSPSTESVLGYEEDGSPRSGVVPLIYQYWGGGAPPGGSRTRQVLMKYSGYVRRSGPARLVFGGQGTIRAYVTRGTTKTLLAHGRTQEPTHRGELFQISSSSVNREMGYVISTHHTFQEGDYLEIYYWHNGEDWGGIFSKVMWDAPVIGLDFLDKLRNAPVVGTSFMSAEESTLPPTDIPYVLEATLQKEAGSITEVTLTVAAATSEEPDGLRVDRWGDVTELVDNANSELRIKKGRTVHLEGILHRPDGTQEVYPRFTGYISDFYVEAGGETITIECKGIEAKLADVMDENLPDPLSYHANGYLRREGSAEPVYGIPAFDHWPLELVITDLCYRAGIDAWNVGTYSNVRRLFSDWTTGELYEGNSLFSARALANRDRRVRLERNPNYGNVGYLKKDYLPDDDEYLFRSEITRRLYDRVLELSDHYGYDFTFSEDGFAVLAGRNNPVAFQYMTKDGDYAQGFDDTHQKVAASAVGGIYEYRVHSDGAWTKRIEGHFSRLDLYAGVGIDPDTLLSGGILNVSVDVHNGTTWTPLSGYPIQIDTSAGGEEAFYYDNVIREDGTNAAVFNLLSLPFDRYRVTITPAGPASGTDCVYRLNGVAVFERDPEQTPLYREDRTHYALSTLDNVLSLSPEAHFEDLRNQVIVVGARKATITDSRKIQDESDDNPNNPEREFHVAVAADPYSIYDPTSDNFVGGKRMALIFDDRVTDGDFARWLARTILYRYRLPKTSATVDHTVLPTLELRDALFVVSERHRDVEQLLWVSGYTETWTMEEATSSITLVPYPEIPSYQPREDVDIDALFDHDGDGKGEPIINLRLSYKNVLGQPVDNYSLSRAGQIKAFATRSKDFQSKPMFSEAVPASPLPYTLPRKAILSTLYLGQGIDPNFGGPTGTGEHRILKNHPYRHFYNVTWESGYPTLHWDFQEGDGTEGVYDQDYYGFPTKSGAYPWRIYYDYLLPRTDWRSPFYDPYTSEVGNFVSIQFDALVSGRYRVSIWDANRADGKETPIAWLTNPTQDPLEEDHHWAYVDAGSNVEFYWDGVDNIGIWNRLQSQVYAQMVEGSFGDEPLAVGSGFYAWNDGATNPYTLIGDDSEINHDSEGRPHFTIGQFGQFLVKVEVLNDDLVLKDLYERGTSAPRTVRSDALPYYKNDDPNEDPLDWHPIPEPEDGSRGQVYVWTHLGEPTQVGITVEDWVSPTPWTEHMDTSDPSLWSNPSTPDADAAVREDKPIRVRFHPIARRGPLFQEDPEKIGVQLHRQVHLKTTTFDQFWTLTGMPWDFGDNSPQHGAEEKRLTSRMYHNEDHTVSWNDSNFRTGTELSKYEWIFAPQHFRKDFGSGLEESLRYGDYEQLESIPGFDSRESGATTRRAYKTLAFISYLFYVSAHVLDRSGRRQWCINRYHDEDGNVRGFIDKSKIVTPDWLDATDDPTDPEYGTNRHRIIDYEDLGADKYLIRSIFVRQWKEPGWADGTNPRSPVARYNIPSDHRNYAQFEVRHLDFGPSMQTGIPDPWLVAYSSTNSGVNRDIRRRGAQALRHQPTFPSYSNMFMSSNFKLPGLLGTWHFDRPGVESFYVPSPAKDFMPYWRYPDMPDWATARTDQYIGDRGVHVLMGTGGQWGHGLRDLAESDLWQGYAFSAPYAMQSSTAREGARVGLTAQAWGNHKKQSQEAVDNVFNYVRQDTLDRFDQFRGVRSRGQYSEHSKSDADYWEPHKRRAAPVAPVIPGGIYLLNIGNYNRYVATWVHANMSADRWLHAVELVYNLFDLRFRSEYVWTNDRYYPVDQNHAAVYAYFKSEYTGAAAWAGPFWWQRSHIHPDRPHAAPSGLRYAYLYHGDSRIFYDSGAWTGWKDDVTETVWANDPYLRWAENSSRSPRNLLDPKRNSSVSHCYASGGHGWPDGTETGAAIHLEAFPAGATFEGKPYWYRRTNIFDEYASHHYQRLAVGPRVPENRNLVMNLTLSARYAGL